MGGVGIGDGVGVVAGEVSFVSGEGAPFAWKSGLPASGVVCSSESGLDLLAMRGIGGSIGLVRSLGGRC